jgi:hypothetical protein
MRRSVDMDEIITVIVSVLVSAVISGGGVFLFQACIGNRYAKDLERYKAEMNHHFNERIETFRKQVESQELIRQKGWEIKRDACLRALDLVDACFANYVAAGKVTGLQGTDMAPESVAVEDARRVYNELTLVCESTEIPNLFMLLISGGQSTGQPVGLDEINDLRNATRRELGFGEEIDLNSRVAWIVDL